MERIDATGSLGPEYRQVRSNLIKKQDNQALGDVMEHTLVDDPDLRLLEPESRRSRAAFHGTFGA